MSNEQELRQCMFDFKEAGVYVQSMSDDSSSMIIGLLLAKNFSDYKAIGKVGLDELSSLRKTFENFDSDISLKKEGALLVIEGTFNTRVKKIEIPLLAEEFVDAKKNDEPTLNYNITFPFAQKDLKGVFEDIKANKEFKIFFKTSPHKLVIELAGKYKFTTEYTIDSINESVVSKFGKPFYNAVLNLDGDMEISIKKDYPITIHEETDRSDIRIIVAPVVSDDE